VRKFNGKSNVAGKLIAEYLTKQNMTKESLCQKLQLLGINIDRIHLYRIIKGEVILKDFELLIICKILNIEYIDLLKLVEN